MKYTVTSKQIKLSDQTKESINKYLEKINKMIPNLESDLVEIDLVLKEHKKRRIGNAKNNVLDGELELVTFKNLNPKTANAIYFDGTIKMSLPHKPLVVHLNGWDIDETLQVGFTALIRELKKYKGKHFASNSEYFDHRTIRKLN